MRSRLSVFENILRKSLMDGLREAIARTIALNARQASKTGNLQNIRRSTAAA